MALPTENEKALLKMFRETVADVLTEEELYDDIFLMRWLRAQELDIKKAEEMLRKAKRWRKERDVDSLVIGKRRNPEFAEQFPKWLDGVDKEGHPVLTIPFGQWDIRKIVREGKSEEFVFYIIECFEETMHAIKVSSKMNQQKDENSNEMITPSPPIHQMTGVQAFLQTARIYEAYYPEILYQGYYINCPPMISKVLALLKPILSPRTMAKLKCFGKDGKLWEEEVLQHFEKDQLRPQFGGTRGNDQKNPFLA